jgi:hypothetical protein
MDRSKNFEKFKKYYDDKDWSIDRLWLTVGKTTGITEAEYQEITGFIYPEKPSVD